MCTLEGHSGTCREYLQDVGIWAVFFSFSVTSWHYGYLCAFFRTFRDAGPRHRCVLVLQIYKFVSFAHKELLYSVSVFSKITFGLVGTTCQAWTTIGHFYFSAACFWCPYHFSASDMSVCCVGISGEEIPDGASPPPINGTLAPGPGECVYHATNTLKSCLLNLYGFFLGAIYVRLNIIFFHEFNIRTRAFHWPCAHFKDTVAPAESMYRTLGFEQYFFAFSFTSWHYGYLCAFFRTFRDAGPRHRCVLVLQIYHCIFYTKSCCIQCLFSPREHLT